jgi:hypothetical protein
MVIGVYARDEGYLVYLLLKNLSNDYSADVFFYFEDRPLFKPCRGKKLFLIPQPTDEEREILNLALGECGGLLLSKECRGLKNCVPIDGDYIIESLKRSVSQFLKDARLEEFIKNYTFSFEDKNLLELLEEKLALYIPLVVAKRDSVLFAWKYYLAQRGVPVTGLLYPLEEKLLEPLLSNVAFTDKIFPLVLGNIDNKPLEVIKNYGFVPVEVSIPSRNNLESELNFIYLAQRVAKILKKV